MTIKEKETKEVVCIRCSSDKVRRTYSPPAIIFTGTGYYTTDKRGKHEKN
jgi:predicted nucleic acid-binding Zn ribbon protein